MASPQTGIFALGTSSHAWLEFDVLPSASPADAVALVASLREPRTTIDGVNLVVGFRPEVWAQVAPDAAPPGAAGFDRPVTGPTGQVMPATQHDIVVWLTGSGYDVVFDVSRAIVAALAAHATLAHEIVGWPYHHDRDLTGFIDGTENPSLIEAMSLALIPEGEPGAGGSILLLQQWEHDIPSWEALTTEAQEAVIGRRKMDSVELDPRPEGSHVARTDQDAFGDIFRRNIAYGSVDPARHDLRRVQRDAGGARWDARQHGRPARRRDRRADALHDAADRRVLRRPLGRPAGGLQRSRGDLRRGDVRSEGRGVCRSSHTCHNDHGQNAMAGRVRSKALTTGRTSPIRCRIANVDRGWSPVALEPPPSMVDDRPLRSVGERHDSMGPA